MKKILCLIMVLAGIPLSAQIDFSDYRFLYGAARHFLTSAIMTGVRATLMDRDSTVIDTMTTSPRSGVSDVKGYWMFYLHKDSLQSEYILKLEKEGYETVYKTLKPKFYKRQDLYFLGDTRMRKVREQKLGEATVQVTRVKFYTKGDTLVYNADAFQLAEGSMLDALIRQLPGAELKPDGSIYVNGRFVESLLLNGEDFFRGDNTVMLDNLPAYMVKNVKVFDKTHWTTSEKVYTMDVRLKRQYSVGWIANAEGALGTEDRYLARLFALRFTPHSRLSLFGNLNNLNESRKPGQDGDWSPSNITTGLTATRQAGADYLVSDKNGFYKINGNATVQHQDDDAYSRSSGTSFLPQGDQYTYGMRSSGAHRTTVSTDHELRLDKTNEYYIRINPTFNYRNWRNTGLSASATLSERPAESVSQLVDSILSPESGSLLRRLALNRQKNESLTEGTSYSASLYAFTTLRLKRINTDLDLTAQADFDHSDVDDFSHSLYEYPASADAATSRDFRNMYDRSKEQNFYYLLKAHNSRVFDFKNNRNLRLESYYIFEQKFTTSDNPYYRLDRLEEWGEDNPLGMLPSAEALADRALDGTNSSWEERTDSKHTIGLDIFYHSGKGFSLKGYLPLSIRRERQEYTRADIDTLFHRTTVYLNPRVEFSYGKARGEDKHLYNGVTLNYRGSFQSPSMVTTLATLSDSDPLNVYTGNPDLKNGYLHRLQLVYNFRNDRKKRMMSVFMEYMTTRNEVAYGFTYNEQTGARTYMPENVNGNYRLRGDLSYTTPLDKARKLTLNTLTEGSLRHNVDLIGYEGDTSGASRRSTVNTSQLGETLRLTCSLGEVQLGLKASASWYRATSKRESFNATSAVDYDYGVTAQARLPWDISLSTDLTMYSRRGYESHGMNSDDLVWNARLSKSVMKGKLTFMLDGFDILHQLSSISYAIDGQGQTETFKNVIPRYFMLHAVYRLNIQPKKRPGDE